MVNPITSPYPAKVEAGSPELNCRDLWVKLRKGEDVGVDQIQEQAQFLTDPDWDAPKALKIMNNKEQIHAFVAGLVHSNNRSPYALNIEGITWIVNQTLKTDIPEDTRVFLENELQNLAIQKRVEETYAQSNESVKNVLKLHHYYNLIEKGRSSVNWADIKALVCSKISLRHVSSHETAQSNKEKGCIGDALSISTGITSLIMYLSSAELLSVTLPLSPENIFLNNFESICAPLSDEDKCLIAREYEARVYQFIHKGILDWDNPIDLNDKVEGWMEGRKTRIEKSSAFLLIQQNEVCIPYDQKNYFALGKLGTRILEPECFKNIITPTCPDIDGDQDFTEQLAIIDRSAIENVFNSVLTEARQLAQPPPKLT